MAVSARFAAILSRAPVALLLCAALAPGRAAGQGDPGPGPEARMAVDTGGPGGSDWFGGRPWPAWTRLTGDWAGARDRAEMVGVRVVAGTSAELAASAGGVAPLQVSDVAVEVVVPGLGLRGYAQVHGKSGRDGPIGSDPVHGLSNVEAEDFLRAGEVWLEVEGAAAGARARAGLVDANAEFAAAEAASSFLNPALGLSPALDHLPSYPAPAPAVTGFAGVGGAVEAGVGVFATPDGGAVAVVQLAGSGPGATALPAWTAGVVGGGGEGRGAAVEAVYLMVEPVAGDRWTSFLSFARSFRGAATASHHVSAGLTSSPGALGGVAIGLAGSWLRPARAEPGAEVEAGADEALVEAFARIEVTPWLAIQPDLQVTAPLDGSAPPRAAGLLRLRLHY